MRDRPVLTLGLDLAEAWYPDPRPVVDPEPNPREFAQTMCKGSVPVLPVGDDDANKALTLTLSITPSSTVALFIMP